MEKKRKKTSIKNNVLGVVGHIVTLNETEAVRDKTRLDGKGLLLLLGEKLEKELGGLSGHIPRGLDSVKGEMERSYGHFGSYFMRSSTVGGFLRSANADQ